MTRLLHHISGLFRDDTSKLKKHLDHLRSKKNVFIDQSVRLGKGSEIIIEGDCKKFVLEAGVSARKYCQFLLHDQAQLIIGRKVFFNNFCSITSLGAIEIGEATIFGEAVKIYDHNHMHHLTAEKTLLVEREKFNIGKINIGKNCWIGSNVTILNNVSIGDNVVIGAHCLIYQSIPSNSFVKHKEEIIIRATGGPAVDQPEE